MAMHVGTHDVLEATKGERGLTITKRKLTMMDMNKI